MNAWKQNTNADPIAWLLEPDCPPVRLRALAELLDRPADDPEFQAERAALPAWSPLAGLLAAQAPDGHWGSQDYYLPRAGRSTFWTLSALGDLGFPGGHPAIQRACELMFTQQRENGEFCRRHGSGRSATWLAHGEPCTQARIARLLIQFGYAGDPRLRRAVEWLLASQRDDGMWLCRGAEGRGCLRATLDVLRVAALDPLAAAWPGIPPAAESVSNLLLAPRLSRYHVGEAWGVWERLKYPYFGVSLLSALEALALLGFRRTDPRLAAAVDYLLSRQLPDGRWPLDECWPAPPLDFGRPGQPNKWLTLDALRVIRLLE